MQIKLTGAIRIGTADVPQVPLLSGKRAVSCTSTTERYKIAEVPHLAITGYGVANLGRSDALSPSGLRLHAMCGQLGTSI